MQNFFLKITYVIKLNLKLIIRIKIFNNIII